MTKLRIIPSIVVEEFLLTLIEVSPVLYVTSKDVSSAAFARLTAADNAANTNTVLNFIFILLYGEFYIIMI